MDEQLKTESSTEDPIKASEELNLSHLQSPHIDRLRELRLECTKI